MSNLNLKRDSKTITKEELEELYFNQKLTLDKIGRQFGYLDRQPIMRLFKKFGIVSRDKKTIANTIFNLRLSKPTKQELEQDLKSLSAVKIAKKYKVSRVTIIKWLKEYELKTDYFVNDYIKQTINNTEYSGLSPKEISLLFGVDVGVIKYYKKDFTQQLYGVDEIVKKLTDYKYDLDNQGLPKQIQYDDENLYNSILNLTKNHVLESDKLTERLYRLYHNYEPKQEELCKYCESKLKFYTFKIGYGNSNAHICKNCLTKHCGFGVSIVSQKLFDDVYKHIVLEKSDNCKYHNLNGELVLTIDFNDVFNIIQHKDHLNRHKYHIDFVLNDKIIEFDGTYWHTVPEKELAKDAFLELKGYKVMHVKELDYKNEPEKVLQNCLTFLKT